MAAPFAEIEIRGYLDDRERGPRWLDEFAQPRLHVEDVIAAIDAAAAAGVKVLLLVVNAWGGLSAPTDYLCDRIRRFSAEGGLVVAWVKAAGSGNVEVALAADVVVIDPKGRYLAHSARVLHPTSLLADEALRRALNARRAAFMAERSLLSVDQATAMLIPMGHAPHCATWVEGDAALGIGFADLVGDLGVARSLARECAERGLPAGWETRARQSALAKRRCEFGGKAFAPPRADAVAALATLTDIASDSLLTPVEKPPVIREYGVITNEQVGIDAQATAYGITSLKTAYDNAVSALTTYLGTLTTPVAWNNLTGNTTIVGATFRTKFADVYAARQALLDGIAANSFTQGQADSTSDTDNLWPNPSSEIAPPAGASTGRPEWQDRYNAGPPPAGAFSGSWVRQAQTGAALSGFWLPCSPGATFYAEARGRRTAGTATGGRLRIQFYSEYGNFGSGLGTASSSANVSSGTWGKVAVTSAAAPTGATAVHIGYWADSGDTVQFDALYARRVAQPEIVASEVLSVTWGTGWTTTPITYLRRSAGLVVGDMGVTAAAGAAWTSIFTLPVGARPLSNVHVLGLVADQSSGLSYVGRFLIDTAGVCQLVSYDNETSVVAPFAIGVGDFIQLNFAFPWI